MEGDNILAVDKMVSGEHFSESDEGIRLTNIKILKQCLKQN